MADERRGGVGEGIREGIGILSALKEAVEETIDDALKQGDLGPERARTVLRDAAERLQETIEDARERFEPVGRREFEELKRELTALRARVERLESGPRKPPPELSAEGTEFPVD